MSLVCPKCISVIKTYFFECLEVEVRELNDVERLVTQDFSGVIFKDLHKAFG